MFSHPIHGRNAQRHHHDPRALGWELMMGFPPGRHGRGRKPHRGELPDVELPPPPPRPRFAELVRRLFRRSATAADTSLSAADGVAVGKSAEPLHIGADEAVRPDGAVRVVRQDLAA